MDKKKIDLKEIGLPKIMILVVAGVLLLLVSFSDFLLPSGSKSNTASNQTVATKTNTATDNNDVYAKQLEQKLKEVLQKVNGVGDVDIMITLASTEEKVTLKDTPYSKENQNETDSQGAITGNTSEKYEEKTVLVEGENGNSSPYVVKEVEPQIEGIVVVAKGGDDIQVKKEIMESAEVLFGVSIHKIKVMKMQ